MTIPTVAALCASLPGVLSPAPDVDLPDVEVSAVHVSELADPTAYLSGGELLLTTGLSLPDDVTGCDRYVSRLVSVGVSALGLGLGPSLTDVPAPLADACLKHGLCLLVVPPAAAFLSVTKAYWAARSRSTQQELTDAITAHRSLVDAMVSRDPVGQTLKALSASTGAWVARLEPSGDVERVFPSGRIADALRVSDQIATLRVAGMHSSATFPLGDDVVAVFPLPLEERVVGYIAVGAGEPLTATARRLVLTAGALLSLDSVQRQRSDAAAQAQRRDVSLLLDMGFVDPARRLLARMGHAALGDALRVLVVRSSRAADVVEAVHQWTPTALPGPFAEGISWFVVPESHPSTSRVRSLLEAADPTCAAILSDPVAAESVHRVRVGLTSRVAHAPRGLSTAPTGSTLGSDEVGDAVARVLAHPRADLVVTLAAYLRHRGHWDAAAREVGVHRNTVRHRVETIREVVDADVDDPDVAAALWIHLRANGMA